MKQAAATAGFRNAEWAMTDLPSDVAVSVHPLATEDGASVTGFLYRRRQSDQKIVLCIMHPREFLATHYLIPELLMGGYTVWTQTSRSVGSDLRLEHETALLDVAAGIDFLRRSGFVHVVPIGNSGGASLYGFYNQQSLLSPDRRLAETPAGRPTLLRSAALPEVDALVLVSPHPGQGIVLQNCIDPSVTEETDPLSLEPGLDFLAPQNGYRDGAQGSRYAPEFVERYRTAQRRRIERLDKSARQLIAHRNAARAVAKTTNSREAKINAAHTPVVTVWRTDADLRCWDPGIDPSDRTVGSIWGENPIASNYGAVGFARLCTPEAWLSTWSGLSSRANLFNTARSIEQPCLLIDYTGDRVAFPADIASIFGSIRAGNRRRVSIRGDHHGRPLTPGEEAGRIVAGETIRSWLKNNFQ